MTDRCGRCAGRAARALLLLVTAVACRGDPTVSHRAEAGRIVRAIAELRAAPNDAKASLLPALAEATCSASDLCRLRDGCLDAYRQHVAALEEKDALARSLAAGAPTPDATTRLDAVERKLTEARDGALDCSRRELAVRARYRP
ncbi:MAG TPA: hypothetical protein PLU22_19525 [Polyangiaceae bacterium]|nr:hypothetical protein [Polyangiaceae bacterium]